MIYDDYYKGLWGLPTSPPHSNPCSSRESVQITNDMLLFSLCLQSGKCMCSQWVSQCFSPTQQWSSWSYCYTFLSGAFRVVSGSSWAHLSPAHTLWWNTMLRPTYHFSCFLASKVTTQELFCNFYTKGLNQFNISCAIIFSFKLLCVCLIIWCLFLECL
jgi:hypothetical protein